MKPIKIVDQTSKHLFQYLTRFLPVFAIAALFVVALTTGRVYFLVKYSETFSAAGFADIAASFLRGLRFDLSTTAIVAGPFLLISLFPGIVSASRIRRALFRMLLAWQVALLVYLFIDIQYYAFAQRHLTFEIRNAWTETGVILGIGFERYTLETIGLFLFIAAYSIACIKTIAIVDRMPNSPASRSIAGYAREIAVFVLAVGLSVLFIRGGLQMKPLGVRDAFSGDHVELGVLSLNGIYTTISSLAHDGAGAKSMMTALKRIRPSGGADDREAAVMIVPAGEQTPVAGYPLYRKYGYKPEERRPLNVVVFVMESWSAKYIGALGGSPSATPFFDSLAPQGLLLANCFANAQRSIEGLTSTLGSIPASLGVLGGHGEGLLYQTRFAPIGTILDRHGYETLFIHGARRGSMGFERLVKKFGIRRHISREDFDTARPGIDDGRWGIFDEHAFLRANDEFSRMKKPFFAVVYSLSSHTPYPVPSKEFEHFRHDAPYRDYLNSLRYSDYALSRFFEAARKEKYFDNTVFMLVGDHTEGAATGGSLYDSYRIPGFVYGKGIVAPGRFEESTSQADVVPTILDILHVSEPFTSWGRSVYATGPRSTLLPRGDMMVYVKDREMLLSNIDRALGLYDYAANPGANLLASETGGASGAKPAANALNGELASYLLFSYDLMMQNRIAPPAEGGR
ncbi:MAG: sulfatase-like hydrolase/transferase [Nitrospirae bacterium]|nr:sulfatase-like hydrolase/transferase [Nitrospirota bacterium]